MQQNVAFLSTHTAQVKTNIDKMRRCSVPQPFLILVLLHHVAYCSWTCLLWHNAFKNVCRLCKHPATSSNSYINMAVVCRRCLQTTSLRMHLL